MSSSGVYPGADLQRQRCTGETASSANGRREGLARDGDSPADGQWEGNHHYPGTSFGNRRVLCLAALISRFGGGLVEAEWQCSPLDSQTCLEKSSVLCWALLREAVTSRSVYLFLTCPHRKNSLSFLPFHLGTPSSVSPIILSCAPPGLCVHSLPLEKLGAWFHPDPWVGILLKAEVSHGSSQAFPPTWVAGRCWGGGQNIHCSSSPHVPASGVFVFGVFVAKMPRRQAINFPRGQCQLWECSFILLSGEHRTKQTAVRGDWSSPEEMWHRQSTRCSIFHV